LRKGEIVKKLIISYTVITFVISMLLASTVGAITLTFDDIDSRDLISLGPTYFPYWGVHEGFQFSSTSSVNRVDVMNLDIYSASGPAYSGSYALMNNVSGAAVVTAEDGSLFSFQSVYAKSWHEYNLGLREIKGFLSGTEVASVTLDLTGSWQHIVGNFSNIDRLEFQLNLTPGSGFFLLDDLVLNESNAVPEPSTLLLFGTGLVGIGIFRRKFRG